MFDEVLGKSGTCRSFKCFEINRLKEGFEKKTPGFGFGLFSGFNNLMWLEYFLYQLILFVLAVLRDRSVLSLLTFIFPCYRVGCIVQLVILQERTTIYTSLRCFFEAVIRSCDVPAKSRKSRVMPRWDAPPPPTDLPKWRVFQVFFIFQPPQIWMILVVVTGKEPSVICGFFGSLKKERSMGSRKKSDLPMAENPLCLKVWEAPVDQVVNTYHCTQHTNTVENN